MARELDRPLTREEFNRMLVANAATKPLNVLAPAGVAVFGFLIGAPLWLVVPIVVVAYLGLAVLTYLDEGEADRVREGARAGRQQRLGAGEPRVDPAGLAPPIAGHLRRVLDQEARIRDAIERAELPFSEVSDEVDAFVRAAEKTAGRAQLLHEYLAEEDRGRIKQRLRELRRGGAEQDSGRRGLVEALSAQLKAMDLMSAKLEDFYTEMERIGVELGNVRGSLLSVSATTEAAAQRQLAEDVRGLREQMGAVSEGMSEAYEQAQT